MRSAAHRFLDFGYGFLKSADSLLEELKKRISPGWLKAAARFLYYYRAGFRDGVSLDKLIKQIKEENK